VSTRPAAAMHLAEVHPGKLQGLPGRLGAVQKLVLCSLSKENLLPQNVFLQVCFYSSWDLLSLKVDVWVEGAPSTHTVEV